MTQDNQNRIQISFNRNFYCINAIEEAIEDFSEICESRFIDKNNDNIIVELNPKHKLDVPLKEEFCNYVLGLLKNKGLV